MCGHKALCSMWLLALFFMQGSRAKTQEAEIHFSCILVLISAQFFCPWISHHWQLLPSAYQGNLSVQLLFQGMHFQNFCTCLLRIRLNRNGRDLLSIVQRQKGLWKFHVMLKGSNTSSQMLMYTWRNVSKNIFLASHALYKPQEKQAWRKGVLILAPAVPLNQDTELHKEHPSSHL